MIMNMTIDHFLYALERTTRTLPALFARWETLDDAMCEEYANQIEWLLGAREEVLEMARRERREDVGSRVALATAAFLTMRTDLESCMGIRDVVSVSFAEAIAPPSPGLQPPQVSMFVGENLLKNFTTSDAVAAIGDAANDNRLDLRKVAA